MKRPVELAMAAFVVGGIFASPMCLGYLGPGFENWQEYIAITLFLCGAYIIAVPFIAYDIFLRRGLSRTPVIRWFSWVLINTLGGILVLSLCSFSSELPLTNFQTLGISPDANAYNPALELYNHGTMLAVLKYFVEHAVTCVVVSAGLGALALMILDEVKSRVVKNKLLKLQS